MIYSDCCITRALIVVALLPQLFTFSRLLAQEPTGQSAPRVNGEPGARRTVDGPLIGAYYYPWYRGPDPSQPGRRHSWRNVLRQQLNPPQQPQAGLYNSDDPAVIQQHVAQSRRAGISFWAVSWWGAGSPTDRVFQEAILKHPDAGQLRYAVLYETTGRFGEADRPNSENWAGDLNYLHEHYFKDANYLRIDGRPVLFVYLTRVYFRENAAELMRQAREQVKDLYLVADDMFGAGYRSEWAKHFDAVTAYDVYGQSTQVHRTTRKAIETLAANYQHARAAANSVGAAFIPAVSPGFNDTVVRPGHSPTARYFADDTNSLEGDVFRMMIRDAALPNVDDKCGRLMMVTSFNEWYEDTQIEATAGTAPATTQDQSANKTKFTGGDRYEDYSNLYLDILRETSSGGRLSE
jgi:hypothetical protein